MNEFELEREAFRKWLCKLDQRQLDLIKCDIYLREDYLESFTPEKIIERCKGE